MDPVSLAKNYLLPFLKEVFNTIRGVPNEVKEMEAELERIQDFIHQTDRIIAAEKEKGKQEKIKKKVKLLAEAAYQIEDVIDEYKIHEEQQPGDLGCAALPRHIAAFSKTMIFRYQTAQEIQSIKSQLNEIKESSKHDNDYFVQFSLEQGASSSTGNQDVTWQNLREAPLHMGEADIVGFEAPSDELIGWLMNGRAERTVISVVGMGGLGKTTLAKKVFDNQKVIGHFDCCVWITVSESYTVEGLLRDLLKEFHKGSPPQNISTMDQRSMIKEVKNYLAKTRYFILFDDVWRESFWDDINFALIDDKNQSRILITTRNMDVAVRCKKSSFVEIHELQLLSPKESWVLFCKKAFQIEFDGHCPPELQPISSEIVEQCSNLPLAIVAIGGLLSTKVKTILEWEEFSRNLRLELGKDQDLVDVRKILDISYNDLPDRLKSCFLYLGIYPEDYEIETEELIQQWVAEAFSKEKPSEKRVAEEVAEEYLRELISRCLVQVSSRTIGGKAIQCRVHDMLRKMIVKKFQDLSFCHVISSEDNKPALDGVIRRLSIQTNSDDLLGSSIESPHLRSLHAFTNKVLPEDFVMNIPDKYKLLKVLHFRIRKVSSELNNVPENLGNLIHLKYLSLRGTTITILPESIGNLQNLESLDIWGTLLRDVPKEITKLRKMKHFQVDSLSWIEGKDGIGGMASLQTLCIVNIRGDEQAKELEKLEQLRTLWVRIAGSRDQSVCFSIDLMKLLETLYIEVTSSKWYEPIDMQLNCISSPPRKLQKLHIKAQLHTLPEWFLKLEKLVELELLGCELTEDPLPLLKNMSSLLFLSLDNRSYKGETLRFQNGWFRKLKELQLRGLLNLNNIIIDGTLPSLEKLHLVEMGRLWKVPFGIRYLENLQILHYWQMSPEFMNGISPDGGKDRWIIEHVPLVRESRTRP